MDQEVILSNQDLNIVFHLVNKTKDSTNSNVGTNLAINLIFLILERNFINKKFFLANK